MISPLLPSHDADTVALDFGVFIAERARTYRCSREAIIAAVLETIPLTPPSRPGETSRSHAPAAQTDGAAESSSLPTEPSVDLSAPLHFSDHPAGGKNEVSRPESTDASQERAQTATGLGAGGDNPDPTSRPTATAKTDVPSDRGQASGGGQSQDNSGVRVASVEHELPSPGNAPEPESRSTESRPSGSGDFLPIGKRKEARERVQAVFDAHPDWTPSQIAAEARVHVSTSREWIRQMKAGAVAEAAPETEDREAKLRAMFDNGQPTATEAANALGYIGQGGVRKLAKRLGLEFRPVSKAEVADRIRSGMQHTAARTAKAETTEALRRATARPQEAVEPPPAPEARPEAEQPPTVIPAATALPVLPPPVVPQRSPQGRFYLRERTDITGTPRYVHQSLQPCPTGPGPLMTSDRKWAWYDTMERFKGAVKKWPELRDMRKEAAAP